MADNTNPLILTIGNPSLKQEFIHSLSFNANSFKVLSQRGFFMYGNVTVTNNAIVTNQTTIPGGITTYRYVNTNGNYNAYAGLNYFKKFTKADFNLNWGLNFNGSRYSNFVNGEKNRTNNYAPGIELGFNKQKEKKYNINYWANINYNISTSSINEELKTKYWTQAHNLDLTVYFLKKFELNNEVHADFRQKTDIFNTNNNVVVWNGYIGRKFLKNDKGLLKFYVYDLLNQNKGYDRDDQYKCYYRKKLSNHQPLFHAEFCMEFFKNSSRNAGAGTVDHR